MLTICGVYTLFGRLLKFSKKVKVFFEKFLKLFNKRYRELMESFYL